MGGVSSLLRIYIQGLIKGYRKHIREGLYKALSGVLVKGRTLQSLIKPLRALKATKAL